MAKANGRRVITRKAVRSADTGETVGMIVSMEAEIRSNDDAKTAFDEFKRLCRMAVEAMAKKGSVARG